MRRRASGAVIWDGHILMVRHVHDGRDYWTLPGGGIDAFEEPARAAEREVLEETGLIVLTERYLFTSRTARSETMCFLMSTPEDPLSAALGIDPEQAHMNQSDRMLQAVEWHSLDSMRHDVHVSLVLKALECGLPRE